LEQPANLTFPCRTSSSSAPSVSSIGVAGSGRCRIIDIDPLGLEPLQAPLHSRQDITTRAARKVSLIVHRQAEFRGEDQVLAAVAQRYAEQGLGPAAIAIDIGGVEEVDAGLDRRIDHGPGLSKVEPSSEIVAPKAKRRNHEAGAAE
jgi:hypothetical protein